MEQGDLYTQKKNQKALPGETELERRKRLGIPIPPIPDAMDLGNGVSTRIVPDWLVPVAPPFAKSNEQ